MDAQKQNKLLYKIVLYGVSWLLVFIMIVIYPLLLRTVLSLRCDSAAFTMAGLLFYVLLFAQFVFPALSIASGVKRKKKTGIILGIIESVLSSSVAMYVFLGGFAFF